MYTPINDSEFRVFCDQRHLKGLKRAQFKEILKGRLLPVLPAKSIIQIEMIDSTSNANIQVADWINGAIACYHNKKTHGDIFYQTIKNNIIGSKELFKDYWIEKQKTQPEG